MTSQSLSDLEPSIDDGEAESAGVQLADRIAREVIASQAPPGTVLASQMALMTRHEAGRPVFRQAVRILEERGVAFMKRGHGGGLVVAEPSADFAARSLSILLESQTADLASLVVLPMAVDSHLFVHSSGRLSVETCDGLRRLARRLDRLPEAEFLRVGAHRHLHGAIRMASGEPALILAHRTATENAMDIIPYSVSVVGEGSKDESWRLTCSVAEALIAGDIAALFDCQRRQLAVFEESRAQWSAIERDPALAPKVSDTDRPEFQLATNRAERLAREIVREIRLMGWKAGERIGGGAELMERYGASASILRQAVRMLQEHSAVEIERGRKGGLFVAVPDRGQAVERAQAFLRRSGAAAADVRAFLVNLTLAALDSPRASGLRRDVGAAGSATFGEVSAAIARALANPPLELFVEIFAPFLPLEPARPSGDLLQALASADPVQRRRAYLAYVNQQGG